MKTAILGYVNQNSAIRAGENEYGRIYTVIDPAILNAAQRETLCQLGTSRGGPDDTYLPDLDMKSFGQVTPESIASRLTEIAKEKAAEKTTRQAQTEERILKWLGMTDDEFANTYIDANEFFDAKKDPRLSEKLIRRTEILEQWKSEKLESDCIKKLKRQEIEAQEAKDKAARAAAEAAEITALTAQIDGVDVLLKYGRVTDAKRAIVNHYVQALKAKIAAAGYKVVTDDDIHEALGLDEDDKFDYEYLSDYKQSIPVDALRALDKYKQIIPDDGDVIINFPKENDPDPLMTMQHTICKYGQTERVEVEIYSWE